VQAGDGTFEEADCCDWAEGYHASQVPCLGVCWCNELRLDLLARHLDIIVVLVFSLLVDVDPSNVGLCQLLLALILALRKFMAFFAQERDKWSHR
jgi:hypothetical protein